MLICWYIPLVSVVQPKPVDVSCAISRKYERSLERQFGLVSHGGGWTRIEGMLVPGYHLFCHRPMTLPEARRLYSVLFSKLSQKVAGYVQEHLKYLPSCKSVPLDLTLSFTPSNYKGRFCYPYLAMIANVDGLVWYACFDKEGCEFFKIYREPEWNLVQWSDQYTPEIDLEQVKSCD